MTNWLSYDMANLLQWQGLGDIINAFRSVTLGLEPLTQRSGPYIVDRLRIPYTYCWSDGLIQKPPDWGRNVGECGVFLTCSMADMQKSLASTSWKLIVGSSPSKIWPTS
jgi:sterol 3beta-glucosyltransferase